MTTENRNAVIHIATGAVLRYGFTDFIDDHDPALNTIVPLDWSAAPIKGVPLWFQKIDSAFFVEMTPTEKTSVSVAGLVPTQSSKRYHNAEVDPESASDGDRYFNTLLGAEMQYDGVLGKWLSTQSFPLHVERNGVTPAGAYYRGSDGLTMSKTRGVSARSKGTVVTIAYTRDTDSPATFEIVADGEPIAELYSTSRTGFYNHLNGDFEQGAILAVRNKAGGSPTAYVTLDIEIRWRA
jgi:hypothetical protein